MRIQIGSTWLCTDTTYHRYNKTCKVLDVEDHPDFNGEGVIEVVYENGDKEFTKVRRFTLRHELERGII